MMPHTVFTNLVKDVYFLDKNINWKNVCLFNKSLNAMETWKEEQAIRKILSQ